MSSHVRQDILLRCLSIVAAVHGIRFDEEAMQAKFDPEHRGFNVDALMRCAKKAGFKSKETELDFADAGTEQALPAIVETEHDGWIVLARIGHRVGSSSTEKQAALVHPYGQPKTVPASELATLLTGRAILMTPRPGTIARPSFGLAWFMPLLVKYRSLIGPMVSLSFFFNLLALPFPVLVQVLFDKVLAHGNRDSLAFLGVGIIGSFLLQGVIGYARNQLQNFMARKLDLEYSSGIFSHLLSLPQAYFDARPTGLLASRLQEQDSIRAFMTQTAMVALLDLVFVFLQIMLIAYYSVELMVVVLCSIPIYLVAAVVAAPIMRSRLKVVFEKAAALKSFEVRIFTGMRTLKVYGMGPRMEQQWADLKARHVRSVYDAAQVGNWVSTTVTIVSRATTAVVLIVGVLQVIDGNLTPGGLVAVNMLTGMAVQPLLRLGQLWQQIQEMFLAVSRLGDIMDAQPEMFASAAGVAPQGMRGDIEVRDLRYTHVGRTKPALDGVTLKVHAGERVGIVGKSGSGKSTLAHLLVRLYEPPQGTTFIDGVDVRLAPEAWLRRGFGVALQESDLQGETIFDAIAMRYPSAAKDDVFKAATQAGAHEFIMELPQGYATELNAHGNSLSGGQQQRISLARALLGSPRVLVLDEATSSLDVESEQAILGNMDEICRGRTVLVITHRASILAACSRIIVMHNGKVAEDGTPAELLQRGGFYARMAGEQSK